MNKKPETKPGRQQYAPPRLVRYGDVAHLTRTRLRGNKKDNGKALKTRTR